MTNTPDIVIALKPPDNTAILLQPDLNTVDSSSVMPPYRQQKDLEIDYDAMARV